MREIKTAGYWFVYACLCTQTESGSVNTTKKKERGQYPPILAKQGWSMNYNLFYGKRKLFSCETQRVISSGQGSAIFAARIANHSTGFGSSSIINNQARKS